MEFSLVKFDGKPIEKLIGEVSKAIGTVYKPRAIRKEAEAEYFKIEAIAKANAQRAIIEYETETELIKRTKERLFNQEINRQQNIEEITEKSIDFLPETVSDKPLDSDWRTRFFNKAQDISETETQEIWAKILAGEISNPGKISLRTLEVLSNLNKNEAEIFEKASSLATTFDHVLKLYEGGLDNYGLNFNNLLILKDAGLIHTSENLAKIYSKINIPNSSILVVFIGKEVYQLLPKSGKLKDKLTLPQIAFTNAGKELCTVLNVKPNETYLTELKQHISDMGFELNLIKKVDNSST